MRPLKLYVIVDNRLSPSQKAVQAAHGVAQYMLEHPGKWNNETIVLMRGHPEKLEEVADSIWREPDMGNRITAAAILAKRWYGRLL